MGRGRIPMELIKNEKSCKTTFQKRKEGLMKKIYEFSTLCGVDVCLILYALNFDGREFAEPETWPQDKEQVQRIIQKYHNTTSDRRPKIYDIEEYYNDRVKKVQAEISKVHKDKVKSMYPTWDESFTSLGHEQLMIFLSVLDAKIEACNNTIKNLKQDPKGKAIIELDKIEIPSNNSSYMASNPSSSHLAQNFPPYYMMNNSIGDNNNSQLPFYPFQFSHGYQSPMFQFDQNYMQFMGNNNGMVDWTHQLGDVNVAYDPKFHILKEYGAQNNQNLQGNYNLQSLPPQNLRSEAALRRISQLPPGYQSNEVYDTELLEAQKFNYKYRSNGRK